MYRDILTLKEIVEKYMNAGEAKLKAPLMKTIVLGMVAGAAIALGAAASAVAMYDQTSLSVARTIGGCIFPVGLMLIVLVGGELFTGDCLLIMDVLDHRITFKQLFSFLTVVFFSNLAGALLITLLVGYSRQWHYGAGALAQATFNTANAKCSLSIINCIASGILCNILVCMAVLMALASNSANGKIFACFFVILAFVVSGYEHCVANMYYLNAGWLAGQLYDLGTLSFTQMYINNILFVTIGNIIGGFLVGSTMYYISKK